MPTLLPNPFLNAADAVMPSAEQAAASPMPSDAAADPSRFDRLLNGTKLLRDTCLGLACMEPKWAEWVISGEPSDAWLDDQPPLFLSDPSDDFIANFHHEVLPMLETLVRRAG